MTFLLKEIDEGFNSARVDREGVNPCEDIKSVDRSEVELPEDDNEAVGQDTLDCLRGWKISLQDLFRAQRRNTQQVPAPQNG
jgi:hypothetical protein